MVRSVPTWSPLFMTTISATSSNPAFGLNRIAKPWCHDCDHDGSNLHDLELVLPDTDRFDQNHVIGGRLNHAKRFPGRAGESALLPACRHALMKTIGSSACCCILMRSPNTAPR